MLLFTSPAKLPSLSHFPAHPRLEIYGLLVSVFQSHVLKCNTLRCSNVCSIIILFQCCMWHVFLCGNSLLPSFPHQCLSSCRFDSKEGYFNNNRIERLFLHSRLLAILLKTKMPAKLKQIMSPSCFMLCSALTYRKEFAGSRLATIAVESVGVTVYPSVCSRIPLLADQLAHFPPLSSRIMTCVRVSLSAVEERYGVGLASPIGASWYIVL